MIHNEYAAPSGEEVQFNNIATLLEQNGHQLIQYKKNSSKIDSSLRLKLQALFSGVYGFRARREVRDLIAKHQPSIVFVQNLFPQISPAILPLINKAGVPVLMRVANYRLMCPNGLFYSNTEVCEKCLGGREYWCVLKNCEENIFKSTAYALRSAISRIFGWYENNVSSYICASIFLKEKLIKSGFNAQKINIIPNYVPQKVHENSIHPQSQYVGFAGRISREKGVEILLKAAKLCPEIPFRIAGRWNSNSNVSKIFPKNVKYVGYLDPQSLESFYTHCRFLVSTSNCYETFGISVAEAMSRGKPVVVSRIGVFEELIDEDVTGLLFNPGDAEELASKIRALWGDSTNCKNMGENAYKIAHSRYAKVAYSEKLERVLKKTIDDYYHAK